MYCVSGSGQVWGYPPHNAASKRVLARVRTDIREAYIIATRADSHYAFAYPMLSMSRARYLIYSQVGMVQFPAREDIKWPSTYYTVQNDTEPYIV